MNEKRYERIENGTTTHVSMREGLDEINHAMMAGKRDVRQMSAGRAGARIAYKDGRLVRLTVVDASELAEPVADEPRPEWRTLKGIAGPFYLWGEDDGERIRFASDRKQATGKPVKFTRWWMEGTRYGETEDGRKVHLWGVATKYWAAQ